MKSADKDRLRKLKIIKNNTEITVGLKQNLPIDFQKLINTDENSEYFENLYSGGLTAKVFKLKIKNVFYNLKKKRPVISVQGTDGQTSFLNEIERRLDFEIFKKEGDLDFSGIVDTIYASLKNGFIFSPWIEGKIPEDFTKKEIKNLFGTLLNMEKKGLFEWDLCPGNILITPDNKIKLFDFGYCYRFNPLKNYNSEEKDLPVFHMAERFETRNYMQLLLNTEELSGIQQTLKKYRYEKEAAAEIYEEKIYWLERKKADNDILKFYKNIISEWKNSFVSEEILYNLYKKESFRSYILDAEDDLKGETCTKNTLLKIKKILEISENDYDFIKSSGLLFFGNEKLTKEDFTEKYRTAYEKALKYQIKR